MTHLRAILIWTGLICAITAPIAAAAFSPYLAWRDPIYIAAGFAGIVAMALLLIQPALAAGFLPGMSVLHARRLHRWIGFGLVLAVCVHVGGLWITSPPDVIDALTFNSPTPFSVWGVIAMWALIAAAFIAALRRKLNWSPIAWRRVHASLATAIVAGTIIHTLQIEGTMETVSKLGLCLLLLSVTLCALVSLGILKLRS